MKTIRCALWLLFLFSFSQNLFSEDIIYSISAKKIKPADEELIQIDYLLKQNAVITFQKAELISSSNEQKIVIPLKTELSGDIGFIEASTTTPRSIIWDWNKTLTRLDLKGKYSCKIYLEIPGTKPRAVHLKLISFPNNQYRVPTSSVDVINFEAGTTDFKGANGLTFHGDWHTTVDEGATFYPSGIVSNYPYYNHGSTNFSGYPNVASGSTFLAIKDVTPTERRIWICIAKGKMQGLGGVKYWDFQTRYYKRTDGEEYCKMGTVADDKWSENDYPVYEMEIDWVDNFVGTSNNIDIATDFISIKILPKTYFKMKPGDSVEIKMTVLDKNNEPLTGAEGWLINDFIGDKEFKIGTSGSDGLIKHMVYTPSDTIEDEYDLEFWAKKGTLESESVVCTINLSNKPSLQVFVKPESVQVEPEKELKLELKVRDDDNKIIPNAEVRVIDKDTLLYDGLDVIVGMTDNDGIVYLTETIPSGTENDEYDFWFYATKTNYETSDTVEAVVTVSFEKKIWTYYIGDEANQEYKILDKIGGWEGFDKDKIRYEGNIQVNNYLFFTGKIEIDTSSNINIKSRGEWFLMNKNLPGADPDGKFLIWSYPLDFKLQNKILNFGIKSAAGLAMAGMCKWVGFGIAIDQLELVGGINSNGIKIGGSILIPEVGRCAELAEEDSPPDWNSTGHGSIAIKDLVIATDGISGGFEASGIGVGMMFCLTKLSASYDKEKDYIKADGGIKGVFFDEAALGLGWYAGRFDRLAASLDLGSMAIPIPMPPPSPPIFAWKGFNFEVTGLSGYGNATVTGTGLFCNAKIPGGAGAVFKEVDDLFEFDITLRFPDPNTIETEGACRMFKYPFTNAWMIDGKRTNTLKMWQSLSTRGEINALRFNGETAIFQLVGQMSFTWSPQYIISGSANGSMYIPDLFPGNYWFQLLNSAIGLPWKVWDLGVEMKNTQFAAHIYHFLIGNWYALLDGSKPSTDPNYFKLGKGTFTLANNKLKLDDYPILSLNPAQKEDVGVSANLQSYKSSLPNILNGDTTWVEFDSGIDMERLFVKVWGKDNPPRSILVKPNGEILEGTKSDSTIILFGAKPGLNYTFWMAVEPGIGTWRVGIINPKTDDSVFVFSNLKVRTDKFTINSSSKDREISINWDNSNSPEGSNIDIYLDTDTSGYDGKYIITVPESTGGCKIKLSDSLADCAYYVYAYRWDNDIPDKDYSTVLHQNPKASLPAPMGLSATSNLNGETNISWIIPADTMIANYLIRIRDTEGIDADKYITAANFMGSTNVMISNHERKRISIQSLGNRVNSGCWSPETDITTGLEEDEAISGLPEHNNPIEIYPNPAINSVRISINLPVGKNIKLAMYDILGTQIGVLADGYYNQGRFSTNLDLSSYGQGIYYIRLESSDSNFTEKFVIIK